MVTLATLVHASETFNAQLAKNQKKAHQPATFAVSTTLSFGSVLTTLAVRRFRDIRSLSAGAAALKRGEDGGGETTSVSAEGDVTMDW